MLTFTEQLQRLVTKYGSVPPLGERLQIPPTPDLEQLVETRLPAIPASLRVAMTELARAISDANVRKVEVVLNRPAHQDALGQLTGTEQKVAVGQLLWLFVRESYECPRSETFELYTSFLPVFTEFLGNYAGLAELKNFPKFLFSGGEQFMLAWQDHNSGVPHSFENFYEFHVQSLKDFIASPGFRGWHTQDGIPLFLQTCLKRWQMHLANFTRNRRLKLFINLLDTMLLLLKAEPENRPLYEPLNMLLPAAKRAFLLFADKSEDPIERILSRHAHGAAQSIRPYLLDLQQLYTLGALPDVPKAPEFDESPELTIPFVYRSALEEILGDGVITDDEKEILGNLRDFLAISPEQYQRLFDQVAEAQRLQKIPLLDRDFCPRAFLYRILEKTVEDGVITEEERAIIGKVANALLISQATLAEVFAEVKKNLKNPSTVPLQSFGEEIETVHRLVRYIAMEERIRGILATENGIRRTQGIGKALAELRRKLTGSPEEKALQAGSFAFAAFIYEPTLYLYPVLVLFTESTNIDPMRLMLKGFRANLLITTNAVAREGDNQFAESEILTLANPVIDRDIPLCGVLLDEGLQQFKEGLDESRGKYTILLARQAAMAPVVALQKAGWLDLSGQFEHGDALLRSGQYAEAATTFRVLHQRFPEMFEVQYRLGLSLSAMAQNGIDTENNYAEALDAFTGECTINSDAEQAARQIGTILFEQGKYDEAMQWLKRAYQTNSADLPTLATLAFVTFHRHIATGEVFTEIPAEPLLYLGQAWQLQPNHEIVQTLTQYFEKILNVDLSRAFRKIPVNSLFQ